MRVTGRQATVGLAVLLGVPGVVGLLLPQLVPGLERDAAVVLCIGALLLAIMAAVSRDPMCTGGARPEVARRYLRELTVTMAAYVLVLMASVWLLKRIDPPLLRFAVALLPLLPIGVAVRAMVRYTHALDELQRRIELESLALSTLFVSMLYMTGGLLHSADLLQVPAADAMLLVFPLISVAYGIVRGLIARRYE